MSHNSLNGKRTRWKNANEPHINTEFSAKQTQGDQVKKLRFILHLSQIIGLPC